MGEETPARTAPGEMDVHFGKNNELILWRQIKIKKFRTIIDKIKVQTAQQQAWFKELEEKLETEKTAGVRTRWKRPNLRRPAHRRQSVQPPVLQSCIY